MHDDQCLLIDPGLDSKQIDALLQNLGLTPVAIYCTHGHFDHIGSVAKYQHQYQAKAHLHKADVKTTQSANFLLMAFKFHQRIEIPQFDELIDDGFSTTVGDTTLTVYSCPGHTPGSAIIRIGQALFSGDSLYARGLALSQLPQSNEDQLRTSIMHLIKKLPHDCTVFPGHGPEATLANILKYNQALQDFLS